MTYILPPSLKQSFQEDPVLAQIKRQGELEKIHEVSFYQAALLAMIEQRNHFMVEAFCYMKKYGELEPMGENGEGIPYDPSGEEDPAEEKPSQTQDNGATTETEKEVHATEEKELPALTLLPKADSDTGNGDQSSVKFTKKYE